MKKSFIYLAALSLIAACNKVESPVPVQDSDILIAQIEQETSTKTYMDAHNNIRWSEGDQITGFMRSTLGVRYQVNPSSVGETSAIFDEISSAGLNAGTELDHIIAWYPYSSSIKVAKSDNDYTLNINLPSEQTYAAESFGNGSMAMVAVSENNNITFRNVLGGMKLQLRGTQKVKSISLQGKNNEKLSGAAVVTAYTDETKPAITMASGASTSVTLNCGSGVQLNESTATEFIVALPPVLISKGFTVTVTDAEGQTYTVGTDKANTVLRSSILIMPAFKLGEAPSEDSGEGVVEVVILDRTSLTMAPNTSYTFEIDVDPFDVSDKTLTWSSSAPSVAKVDQDGTVTSLSDGIAVISAVAVGGASASCTVKVVSCITPTADYIDEYGVNHGKGIAIGNTVWAPVNCGYKASTSESKGFPYGKLYQWGRKYGQGYSEFYDESVPELEEGPVMPSVAQSEENKDKFYYTSVSPYDWSKVQKDDLWNSGTDSSPVKTKYDPCPEGWRVPTYAELDRLNNSYSSFKTVGDQKGRYFCGDYTCLDKAPQVFFPAADRRNGSGGSAGNRGDSGIYWSSRPSNTNANYLYFRSGGVGMSYDDRANGQSVRCVQE